MPFEELETFADAIENDSETIVPSACHRSLAVAQKIIDCF